ncbi:MAG TPA: hypothetical protein VLA49_16685 [Anaerolineales bacterium]|nr:hypothetical protein [Anaerolineales bacterium]
MSEAHAAVERSKRLKISRPTARDPTARRKCGWGWDSGEGIL